MLGGRRVEASSSSRSGLRLRWKQLWRGRARPFLQHNRWTVVGGLALVVYFLGYLGYVRYDEDHRDALYHSLQLFALESKEVPDPSWSLTIARFGAPLVTVFAALLAAFVVFREQLQHLRIRWLAHDHVVVAGLGSIGAKLAVAFEEAGRTVVAIESDPTNPSIAGCRERGVVVVFGNAADPSLLRRARLDHARNLVVTCGDDVVNLEVVVAASQALDDSSRGPDVFVHLGDLALWRRLEAHMLASSTSLGFRLEFFNALDSGARLLIDRHPPFGEHPDPRTHVLFIGLDEVGEFALVQIVRRWQSLMHPGLDATLRFTILGPRADEQVAALLEQHPQITEMCTIAAERVEVDSARFQRGEVVDLSTAPVTAAYVCLATETDAFTSALVLRGLPRTRAVPLVVTVWDSETGIARLMRDRSRRFEDVAEFGVLSEVLVPDVALLGTNETLARLRHEEYVRGERARGETVETNPSMVPWEELPESLKESNRAFAVGIGNKLASSNCALVPAGLGPLDEIPEIFDENEVDELARAEHDRWMADLRSAGWQPTSGKKDPIRKLHPLLVDWDDLTEVDRERDRSSIRALPQMLRRTGFEICRVETFA